MSRPALERLEPAGFALVGLIGAGVLVGAFALDGISIGGSACGGGGSEQRCRQIERTLGVGLDLRWFSVAVVAAAVAFVVVGVLGVAVRRRRLALSVVVLVVGLAALIGAEHVESRFCPGDERGTCGRSDGEWGPVLRAPLLDLRVDTMRELVGRRLEPGTPPVEASQTLDTFRANGRDGWKLVHRLAIGLWFLALALLVPRFVRTHWKAWLAVETLGSVSWAVIVDRTHPCEGDGSECYQGLITTLAFVAAGLVWAIAFAAAAVARRLRRGASS